MAEINLLQTQSTISAVKATGQKWLLWIVTLILVVTLLVYAFLSFMSWRSGKQIQELKSEISAVQSEISNNKQRSELVTRQGQLKQVNDLLANHQYWSTFLPELSRVTLASALYTDIDLNKDSSLNLSVVTNTYEEAEKYLQIFDLPEYNKYFSNVKIMSLSKMQKDNTLKTVMRLNLTVNPDLMKQ